MVVAPSPWQQPGNKLFVGGLSAHTTTEALRAHFARYGRIVDVVVMTKQGRPRGFGFVAFEAQAAAAMALSEQQWLDGRYVDVKRAVPGDQPEERAQNKIFVGGLPQETSTEDLRVCFAPYGPIADAVVMVDRRTKRSRGFGFVRFASGVQGSRAAEAVLRDAANHRLGNKWIEVKRATSAASLQDMSPSSCQAASEHRGLQPSLHAWDEAFGLWEGFETSCMPGGGNISPMGGIDGLNHLGMLDWVSGVRAGPPLISRSLGCEQTSLVPLGLDFGESSLGALTTEDGDSGCSSPARGRSTSPSSNSDSQCGENRPNAANLSMTPPPGNLVKRSLAAPPGLGLMASPMKVECSKLFEGLGHGPRFGSMLRRDGFMKVQSKLSVC